jgi:hypothetical protein
MAERVKKFFVAAIPDRLLGPLAMWGIFEAPNAEEAAACFFGAWPDALRSKAMVHEIAADFQFEASVAVHVKRSAR